MSVLAIIENLSTYTSDQCVIQRYMSVKDEKAAARSIWFNGIFTVFVCLVFYCIGTALWTYYRSHPEMLDPSLPKADSILPFFIVSGLPPALAGLVAAALFAATISTLSANLSSAATALTADFVLKFRPSTCAGAASSRSRRASSASRRRLRSRIRKRGRSSTSSRSSSRC